MKQLQKITFVWNEDFSVRGGISALADVANGQHSCSLCGIAYHRVRQTRDWKRYKKHLRTRFPGLAIKEPCRNQLSDNEQSVANGDFPTVLARVDGNLLKLISADEIDQCEEDFSAFESRLESVLRSLLESTAA